VHASVTTFEENQLRSTFRQYRDSELYRYMWC